MRWLRLRRLAHELSGFPLLFATPAHLFSRLAGMRRKVLETMAGDQSSCCEDATCGYGSRELTASGKSQQLTGNGESVIRLPVFYFWSSGSRAVLL